MSDHPNGATHNILLWLTALMSAANLGVAIFIAGVMLDRGEALAQIISLLEQMRPHE